MAMKERILVVDDEQNARNALRTLLGEEGYEIAEAADGEEALSKIAELDPAVVLTDMRMPKMDGITLIRKARDAGSEAAFVMMTAFASVQAAVDAMKAGAENYLTKPLDLQAVLIFLEKALEKRRLQRETLSLRDRVREQYRLDGLVGDAPELRAVYDVVRQAAPTKATVLILGESGTGKEIIARALHEESPRRDKAFREGALRGAVRDACSRASCSGTSAGRSPAPSAAGTAGSSWPTTARCSSTRSARSRRPSQVKLLRVLQDEGVRAGRRQRRPLKVDVRVVAATNRDLAAEVDGGQVPRGPLLPAQRRRGQPARRCGGARATCRRSPHTSSRSTRSCTARTCAASGPGR